MTQQTNIDLSKVYEILTQRLFELEPETTSPKNDYCETERIYWGEIAYLKFVRWIVSLGT